MSILYVEGTETGGGYCFYALQLFVGSECSESSGYVIRNRTQSRSRFSSFSFQTTTFHCVINLFFNLLLCVGIQLGNSCIILDEGHNIEKTCEDSASLQIKTTDITLCIEEVTEVMKVISDDSVNYINSDVPKDFSADELCVLKDMLLKLEKVLDEINVPNPTEGVTFGGDYIFDILEQANVTIEKCSGTLSLNLMLQINVSTHHTVINLMEKIIQVLSTSQNGPFHRKGNGLELLQSLLKIAFASISPEFKEKIKRCYKVIESEVTVSSRCIFEHDCSVGARRV